MNLLAQLNNTTVPESFYMETQYADDADFIRCRREDHNFDEESLQLNMEPFNLTVNKEKTEHILIKDKTILSQKQTHTIGR